MLRFGRGIAKFLYAYTSRDEGDSITHSTVELDQDHRFAFGENWTDFLAVVDEERIGEAEKSLKEMLERQDLAGLSFLDVGSGSGLFSLAAVRLGAESVHSFDFDHQSVRATDELRRRYAPDASHWVVEWGSVLDVAYMAQLGQWDVVYAWGVLHHTGEMESAMQNTARAVTHGGQLFIAIYNDQGRMSRVWRAIKRLYNLLPRQLQRPYAILVMLPFELRSALGSLIRLQPKRYLRQWTAYQKSRGMTHWHDLLDWVGGYPFEVATPERIFEFFAQRGFTLAKLSTVGRWSGCNEYVFVRIPLPGRGAGLLGPPAGG